MTAPTELKAGDRVQVVFEVLETRPPPEWTKCDIRVRMEGSGEPSWWTSTDKLAHGTLLPPKPKPLQVGDRVRDDGWGKPNTQGTIIAIAGEHAWLEGDIGDGDGDHWTAELSGLTRIDGEPS